MSTATVGWAVASGWSWPSIVWTVGGACAIAALVLQLIAEWVVGAYDRKDEGEGL